MSTNHNLSEEKGKPKRDRAEVLLLTGLTPYRWTKPVHLRKSTSFIPERLRDDFKLTAKLQALVLALKVKDFCTGKSLRDDFKAPPGCIP